jgi:hypothetical protein
MIRRIAVRFTPKTAREQRAVGVAGAALGVWLLINLAVRPYWINLSDMRESLARERGLAAREATLLAESRRFPARYAAIERTTLAEAPRLFPGPDALTASAALARYVGGQAAVNRVMVQQSESRPPEDVGSGTVALRVDVRAVSDLHGVADLLYALEHGSKLVRVEHLVLTKVAGPAQFEASEALAIIATVRGYAFADSASGQEPDDTLVVQQDRLGAWP